MTKVIEDSSIAISILSNMESLNKKKIGILGHSYGGNTVLFHSALDKRIKFSCSSGALCSYQTKIKNGTGIELAQVIPGFINQFEIIDLLKCICPRNLLIIAGSKDKFAQDAKKLYNKIKPEYKRKGKMMNIKSRKKLCKLLMNHNARSLIYDNNSNLVCESLRGNRYV